MIRKLALVALLLAPPALAQTRPPAPPADQMADIGRSGWSVDEANGCWIWNFEPQPQETITWSGPCPNGPAEGQGEGAWREPDGKTSPFTGMMANGRMEGPGVYTTHDGLRLEGTWRAGKLDGQGVLTAPDGYRYEGGFVEGRRQGHGVATANNGARYSGEWRNGRREGRGVMIWPNGASYSGQWRDDQPEGRGIHIWPNGDRFEGEFRNGAPTENGVATRGGASQGI